MNRTNVASMAGLALAACVLVATVTACGPPVVGQPGPGSTTDGGATSCEGDSSRSCGRCGVEKRSCLDGRWTEWSVCQDEQECSPGATQACAGGGTQTCLMNCTWDTCQGCQGPSMMLCGNCGQQSRTCSGGRWSSWSACQGDGPCVPKATQACGNGGVQVCGDNCQWGPCQECQGPSSMGCGNCGTQMRTCQLGQWSPWSACQGEGVCRPQAVQACGGSGTQSCTNACQWGACSCPPGRTACNGLCVDPNTDAANCGGCGRACQPVKNAGAPYCSNGSCRAICNQGFSACNNACVDVQSDPDNCGRCGSVCPGNARSCYAGKCWAAMSWTVEDKCPKSPIQYAFFDKTQGGSWGPWWINNGFTDTRNLLCTPGNKVCLGATSQNGLLYWGVSINNNQACANCCFLCTDGDSVGTGALVCP